MADSFEDVLGSLMKQHPAIQAAGFMDIDGADIACLPRHATERLRTGAAFGGIALRRLGTAEKAAGREGLHHFDLQGPSGRLLAFPIGTDYQLILLLAEGVSPGVVEAASEAVERLEAGI